MQIIHTQKEFINILKIRNKNLEGYHDLYVQSNTLLLVDVFENFRNMSIKIYELDTAKFTSAHGLAWQAFKRIR